MDGVSRHYPHKDRMRRKAFLQCIRSLRRLRDLSRRDGSVFSRGMANGYQHSAEIFWREWKEENR